MSFYAKACFIIAGIALVLIPISFFVAKRNAANATEMEFEITRSEAVYSPTARVTIGHVYVKGTHPTKGAVETMAYVDPSEVEAFPAGSKTTGKYVDGEEPFAQIGAAAGVTPLGGMPLMLGFAVVFGALGFFLMKRGGGA